MTDLLTDARKAIDFVVRYSKSINQHPQPTSLIDVAERLVTEVERLHRFLEERVIPRKNPRENGYHMRRVALEAEHLLRDPEWFPGKKAAEPKEA